MVRYSRYVLVYCLGVCFIFIGIARAAGDDPLVQQLKIQLASPELKDKAIFAGRERALICSYCHGDDGNSLRPGVPNLAGQHPDYLLLQISRFANGERKDFVMNSLASEFTPEDRINLAIFYASQKVKAAPADPGKTAQGKQLFLARCQRCHGAKGLGNAGYARLAGQKATYITKTLTRFRDEFHGKAIHNRRRSKIMEPIAAGLTEVQIQQLAEYIAGM